MKSGASRGQRGDKHPLNAAEPWKDCTKDTNYWMNHKQLIWMDYFTWFLLIFHYVNILILEIAWIFHLEFQVERSAEEVADFLRQQEEPRVSTINHQMGQEFNAKYVKKVIQNHFVQKLLASRYWSMVCPHWSILQYLGGWFRELHLTNLSRLESQDDRASFQWRPLILVQFVTRILKPSWHVPHPSRVWSGALVSTWKW